MREDSRDELQRCNEPDLYQKQKALAYSLGSRAYM